MIETKFLDLVLGRVNITAQLGTKCRSVDTFRGRRQAHGRLYGGVQLAAELCRVSQLGDVLQVQRVGLVLERAHARRADQRNGENGRK